NLFEPLLTRTWEPVVYEQEGEPIAYSAIPMGYLAEMADPRPVESISEAVDALRETGLSSGPRDHAQRRERLVAAIDRERDKVGKRLHSLRDQLRRSEQVEELRTWGEMIFGYLWQIQPGDTRLEVDG